MGLRLFPLQPNGKKPAHVGWQQEATSDVRKIRKWVREGHNLGVITDGLCVIDLDVKDSGHETWSSLLEEWAWEGQTVPETLGVRTASGGTHLYMRADDVRNSARKLGKGVDVRGNGGFVVAPGSVVDGRWYEFVDGKVEPIAPAPEFLTRLAQSRKQASELAGQRVAPETNAVIAEARAWIDTQRQIEPGERNTRTYQAACRFFDFGCTLETSLELAAEWMMRVCDQPLSFEELEKAVNSAATSRRDAIGKDAPDAAPGFEPVDFPDFPPPDNVISLAERRARQQPAVPIQTLGEVCASAFDLGPEPLVDELIGARQLSVAYGPSGAGKTFVLMDMDFHIAAGLPWFGRETKQGAVVWVAAERAQEARHRILALTRHYKLTEVPFFLVPKTVDLYNRNADLQPLIEVIRETERRHGVKVEKVTIDTLARVMPGADENSTQDMGILIANLAKMQEALRTHVCVIHHTSAREQRMRGNYALKGAVDTQLNINKNGEIWVEKESGWRDGYKLGKYRLLPIGLGQHPRTGKMVESCVIEPTMWTSSTDGKHPPWDGAPVNGEEAGTVSQSPLRESDPEKIAKIEKRLAEKAARRGTPLADTTFTTAEMTAWLYSKENLPFERLDARNARGPRDADIKAFVRLGRLTLAGKKGKINQWRWVSVCERLAASASVCPTGPVERLDAGGPVRPQRRRTGLRF
jgi:hypothetical protein